ncbi:MAG: DUF2213 domain-containing protein [Betaproteobacteria bacterium]|nr:DUF2213 domain-containing protein [Betaproteobacteria bacterium]
MKQSIDLLFSQRQTTPEGYLRVPARVARSGVQQYLAMEMDVYPDDPMRIINVYRPEEEVFSADAMGSFEGAPVTDDHPSEFVTVDNWRELSRGVSNRVRREGNYLVADLTFTDKESIRNIEEGKVQLSCGYAHDLIFKDGIAPDGTPYQAIQKNIRGNHIALVDAARCGPACRVADSQPQPQGDTTMAEKRKVVVDGVPIEAEDNAAITIDKLVHERDEARAKLANIKVGDKSMTLDALVEKAEKQDEELEKKGEEIEAKDKEIEQLKKDAVTPEQRDALVSAWSAMLSDAKRLAPSVSTDGKTCAAIRKEVVAARYTDSKAVLDAVLSGKTVDNADEATIRTAFSVLAATASHDAGSADTDPLAAAVLLQHKAAQSGTTDSDPREAYINQMTTSWKGENHGKN